MCKLHIILDPEPLPAHNSILWWLWTPTPSMWSQNPLPEERPLCQVNGHGKQTITVVQYSFYNHTQLGNSYIRFINHWSRKLHKEGIRLVSGIPNPNQYYLVVPNQVYSMDRTLFLKGSIGHWMSIPVPQGPHWSDSVSILDVADCLSREFRKRWYLQRARTHIVELRTYVGYTLGLV